MVKIKDLSIFDRPREKLIKYGPGKLTDAELLAILIRTGTKDLNVIKLSQKILNKFESGAFINASIEELKTIHGLGTVKACEILACIELGKRLLKDKKTSILISPKNVWERLEDIRGSKKEHFVVFYLDSRSQEIKREIISIGTLNESLVSPREVFEGAIKNNAASIIIAHNHPSGDLEPSQADIDITKKLVHAGRILDIKITNHIIISSKTWSQINL